MRGGTISAARRFAREFRAVFAREFDRMRAELASGKGKMGWLTWGTNSVMDLIGGVVANLVLAVALSLGKQVLSGGWVSRTC
jgi:hypothetical protein